MSRGTRRLREALRPEQPPLTVSSLADRLGVTRQTVYSWLSGTIPMAPAMARLQDELGIPMRDWAEPDDTDAPESP